MMGIKQCPAIYHDILKELHPYKIFDITHKESGHDNHPEPGDLEHELKAVKTAITNGHRNNISIKSRQQVTQTRDKLSKGVFSNLSPQAIVDLEQDLKKLLNKYAHIRNEFIKHNNRLVANIALRLASAQPEQYKQEQYREDFFQEGVMGLIRAIDRFDVSTGYKFSTYATWWVRQQINRFINEHGATIRIPVHQIDLKNQISKYMAVHYKEHGVHPSQEQISNELKVPLKNIQKALDLNYTTISLHQPAGDDEDSETIGDQISDVNAIDPGEQTTQNSLHAHLKQATKDKLTKKEYTVLAMRYGIDDARHHTLNEIGTQLSLTRERIRQIEHKAITKLRNPRILLQFLGHTNK